MKFKNLKIKKIKMKFQVFKIIIELDINKSYEIKFEAGQT